MDKLEDMSFSCFIIAEAGVNHNGDLSAARKLVDKAAEAGADAVKFQTFKTGNLITRKAPKAEYQIKNTGSSESQFEMLSRLELPADAFEELKAYCEEKGILFMSTPFDFESADLLKSLDLPIYKISSGDLTNIPFIRYIAAIGKPMILSTGMSVMDEIREALDAVYAEGNHNVTVLHCTTNYPTPYNEVNLNAMKTLRESFNVRVGYSDHTLGIEVPIAAAALGACVIEKHFTLDRTLPGPDHKASLEPDELREMVRSIRNIEKALGNGIKEPTGSELLISAKVRKSIFAVKPIRKGEPIKRDALGLKRPGTGLKPSELENVIGRTARRDIFPDEPITPEDIG